MAAKLGIKPNAGLAAIRDVAGGSSSVRHSANVATQRGTNLQWGTCQAQSGANVVVLLDGSASAVTMPVAPDLSASSCVGRRVLVAGRSVADWVVVAGGDSTADFSTIPTEVWFGMVQSLDESNTRNVLVLVDGTSSSESVVVSSHLIPQLIVGCRVAIVGTDTNRMIIACTDTLLNAVWYAPILGNGWVDYGFFSTPGYMKNGLGMVRFRGVIKNGSNGQIFTLPFGYRPPNRLLLSTVGGSVTGQTVVPQRIDIEINGAVSLIWSTLATPIGYLSLDAIPPFSTF